MTNPRDLDVGDFIDVPAWSAYGMVLAVEPSLMGSDECRRVLVQEHPDEEGGYYTLEPGDFVLDD